MEEPPTGNILFDHSTFLQIEGMGILKGANSPNLARKFIDFALERQFQEDFPDKMFVYPCEPQRGAARTSGALRRSRPCPPNISPKEIGEKREAWIEAWTRVVLR